MKDPETSVKAIANLALGENSAITDLLVRDMSGAKL